MAKTDVGSLVSPCCGAPINVWLADEWAGGECAPDMEIGCTNCSNVWDGYGRFISY